jgi:hypothetical protein
MIFMQSEQLSFKNWSGQAKTLEAYVHITSFFLFIVE